METIEEITFKLNNRSYNRFKVYKYEEETIRKIKVPVEIGELTLTMGYKYQDKKVKITKYAIHRETEIEGKFEDIILCETECYSIVLKLLKNFIEEYVNKINLFI